MPATRASVWKTEMRVPGTVFAREKYLGFILKEKL